MAKRDGLLSMLADCERGLIDYIIVKSISRFSRNTVESIETVRKLCSMGIYILFEKENIDTGKMEGELLLSILSSLAESESHSISENEIWSIQKRFRNGTFKISYGEKKAVDNLSLHIAPGEIYGFIGHNGAGKTTTLKSVVGILQFDAGEITIDGISIKENPLECKRRFAYIPDNPDLYDYMTGIKYLNFIADIFGVGANERQARIRKYADAFELTADLAQPIAAYSHGMKQKLAIIAAWLHEPKLILMDEPFVGLDPKASHLLKKMMRQVCNEGGAIFFSTHVLEVAEKLCDKVAIIKNGKLIRSGTMEEVKGDESLEDVFLELEGESC